MNRQKAARHSEEAWRKYKEKIIALHDLERKTHEQIVQALGEMGFHITARQLKSKLKAWGCARNIKLQPDDVAILIRILDRRKREGKRSGVRMGNMILNEKQLHNLQRTLVRHQQRNSGGDIIVFTPSEPALSPPAGTVLASPSRFSRLLQQDPAGVGYPQHSCNSNHETGTTQPPILPEEANFQHLNIHENNNDFDLFEHELSPEMMNEVASFLRDTEDDDAMSEDDDAMSEDEDAMSEDEDNESVRMGNVPSRQLPEPAQSSPRWDPMLLDDPFLGVSMGSSRTPKFAWLLENISFPSLSGTHGSTQDRISQHPSPNGSYILDSMNQPCLNTEQHSEDLGPHLTLMRQCYASQHKEAALRIFEDELMKIAERTPQTQVGPAMIEVFKDQGLQFHEAETRFDAVIAEREQQYGFDHHVTAQTCLGFVKFLLATADAEKRGENYELKTAKRGLERARNVLTKVLKTGFDDRAISGMLDQEDPDGNVIGAPAQQDGTAHGADDAELTEIYITECTKRPHLVYALAELVQYTKLYKSFRVLEAVEGLIAMGLVEKCKMDNGKDGYRIPENLVVQLDQDNEVRISFLRQARAGLATSYGTLELVFVVFSAQSKGSSNESPLASCQ
ncbi:uncharacterized protein PAC_07708 [Phialocephala subalpina]|uniref:Clr5 domain-containing protein n=1 Tax=Phialocephala subalpina TaxID=576137 RepID=A0A1L7WYH0_9HELO|nr:uncharacterized protein PAC_07708 [Phialocephala subalpina]